MQMRAILFHDILLGVLLRVPLLMRLVHLRIELIVALTDGRSKVYTLVFHVHG